MKRNLLAALLTAGFVSAAGVSAMQAPEDAPPLGLPPVPVVRGQSPDPGEDRPGGEALQRRAVQHHRRSSCATCHAAEKAFTDSPLKRVGGHQRAHRHAQRAHRDQRRLLPDAVLGRPLARPRGPGAASLHQSGGDGPAPITSPSWTIVPHRSRVRRSASRRSSARAATASP